MIFKVLLIRKDQRLKFQLSIRFTDFLIIIVRQKWFLIESKYASQYVGYGGWSLRKNFLHRFSFLIVSSLGIHILTR